MEKTHLPRRPLRGATTAPITLRFGFLSRGRHTRCNAKAGRRTLVFVLDKLINCSLYEQMLALDKQF